MVSFCLSIIHFHTSTANTNSSLSDSFFISERVNITNPDTLHEAVIAGNINLVKSLLKDGFDINLKDKNGWTPLDYSKKRNRDAITTLLLENGAKTYPKHISDMLEGPHIRLLDSSTIEVLYLKNDSKLNKSSLTRKTYPVIKLPMKINSLLIESGDIDVEHNHGIPKSNFPDTKKIFIVGDIHGEYERVFSLLKANRIIDKEGKWNWGKGHLVFVGDIFDRGNKVTETLWLIFSLEKQAARSGGRVHLLLGNHEQMIFDDDIRYITDDYYSLTENNELSYSYLFDKRSVLGHWLRQMPVMVQINNYSIMHAGISPELFAMKLNADTINKIVWQYLNDAEIKKNTKNRQFILGSKGLLWYRGFVSDGTRNEIIDETTLNSALEFYNSQTFIIGHTEVDSITSFFGKKVIDVNIPKRNKNISEQGLLIIKNKKWIVNDSKIKIKL